MKKIIYVDMDGVISDFDKAAKEGGWTHRPDLKVNFRNLELIPGAQDALLRLNCSTRTIHRNMCAELKREKELLNKQLENETL